MCDNLTYYFFIGDDESRGSAYAYTCPTGTDPLLVRRIFYSEAFIDDWILDGTFSIMEDSRTAFDKVLKDNHFPDIEIRNIDIKLLCR